MIVLSHKRNTEGLVAAALRRRNSTIKRVEKAIAELLREKKAINFNAVSQAADVGKTWLYKEMNIREKILDYRDKKSEHKREPASRKARTTRTTEDSKEGLILLLRERIKQMENENQRLKKQIAALYGEIVQKK
jgi:uncharacterized protein (UPF0335 family)